MPTRGAGRCLPLMVSERVVRGLPHTGLGLPDHGADHRADDLGLGTASIGLALGVGGLARFAGTLVVASSDRLSRKSVLVPGLLIQSFGVALLSLEPTVTVWVAAIVVMSLASFAVLSGHDPGDITDPARVGRIGAFRFVGDLGLITGRWLLTVCSPDSAEWLPSCSLRVCS